MSFQPLNPDLTAKVLLLANLQRQLMQNQNQNATTTMSTMDVSRSASNAMKIHESSLHPLLMPSLNVSPQKISAMLAALTPPSIPAATGAAAASPTVSTKSRSSTSSTHIRSNGSSFGWGNRERKMDENWRMQHRNNSTK